MYKLSNVSFTHTLSKDDLKKIHLQWFKQYSKENKLIPFKVKKDFNGIISYFLMHPDTIVRFIEKEKQFQIKENDENKTISKTEKVGWLLCRIKKDVKPLASALSFVIYMYMDEETKDFSSFQIFREGKIYTAFLNKLLKKTYPKRLVYFPFWWILKNDENSVKTK